MGFWLGRKVALTGATGFVGHHAALELRRAGADVTALVRPTSDMERLQAAGVACKIAALDDVDALTRGLDGCEFVIHVAGAVGFGAEWEPFDRVNVQGTHHLLQAARRVRIRRFVHTSSIVAVGAAETPSVLDETAAWNLGRLRLPYATTKRLAEEAALAANGAGMDVIVVNPGCVLGPDDFTGSEFGVLCKRFWKGRIPFHFGGGNNFVDVRDVAQGIRLAAERGRAGERYLLTGANQTYRAFFRALSRTARRSIPCLRMPNALGTVLGYLNDHLKGARAKRAYFTSAQAALLGLYFFFDAGKARRELGFNARPLGQTLADAHAFWMAPPAPRRSAA